MTELKPGKSITTLTGKVKISDKSFQGVQVSQTTGYNYVRINLGLEVSKGNVVWCELMGGYSPTNPIIYAMDKSDNKPTTINWADRLNENIVDSVADFKLHKIGITRDEKGQLEIKKFLSPIDVHDYLQAHLEDGMEVSIRGSFEFSEYKGDTQRKLVIQNIYLPFQPKEGEQVQYKAEFTQTILLDEDSFKKISKEEAKEGEVVVSAYVVNYVGKKDGKVVKKNMPFPLPIVVKINKENPELTKKILEKLFNVKKGKVRELTIEGQIIEGYEESEVSSADIELSAEIKELIEMGLYSEEEAKAKMTVRGNKVSKLVFTRPFLKLKDKDDVSKGMDLELDDEKYTPEDLIVTLEDDTTEIDGLEDMGSTNDTVSDDVWMQALNM